MKDGTAHWGGVDWAAERHAACVVGPVGEVVDEFEVPHSALGLAELGRRLRRSTGRVAIERPDGPAVEALMRAGIEVVVVPSRAVKGLRSRYGAVGNKCDRSDAYVLADSLRTDGHRFGALEPDSALTVTLRAHVRARKDLVANRVATANQLREHLSVVFPGAVGLFTHLDSAVSLRFLRRFPSATRARWLSERRLAAWLKANGYCGRLSGAELWGRLQTAPEGLLGPEGEARSGVTLAYVAVLETLREQIAELDARIAEQLALHPDGPIFRSLPRAGTVRAAALLAEIGDCRARFPTPESLACLAGAAPSTRQSGRHKVVVFRWACDKKLRDALVNFAGDSRRANAWAAERYRQARAEGKTSPHADRILARAWAHVIWRCWQDRVPYDPAKHAALQRLEERAA